MVSCADLPGLKRSLSSVASLISSKDLFFLTLCAFQSLLKSISSLKKLARGTSSRIHLSRLHLKTRLLATLEALNLLLSFLASYLLLCSRLPPSSSFVFLSLSFFLLDLLSPSSLNPFVFPSLSCIYPFPFSFISLYLPSSCPSSSLAFHTFRFTCRIVQASSFSSPLEHFKKIPKATKVIWLRVSFVSILKD